MGEAGYDAPMTNNLPEDDPRHTSNREEQPVRERDVPEAAEFIDNLGEGTPSEAMRDADVANGEGDTEPNGNART